MKGSIFDANTLGEAKRVFMLGIGGSGMRGLAKLLAGQGKKVVGSDQQYELLREAADMQELEIVADATPSDSPLAGGELLEKSDVLVYTDAAENAHPLRELARQKNIPELGYHEALGEFSRGFRTIAVTGTHGKSSTTAFLAYILIEAGLDPSVLIGAPVPWLGGGNSRVGKSDLFVVEADEYRRHFLTLAPEHAIITNIDFDHPDYFTSREDVEAAYKEFAKQVKNKIIADEKVHTVIGGQPDPLLLPLGKGESPPASMPGEHMRSNAALAIAMAQQLGVDGATAIAALQKFPGLGRRMEVVGQVGTMLVISDYGHHPAEIAATLTGARTRYPEQKILLVFEAHTLERLRTFFEEYVAALNAADGVLLMPVFVPKGREDESSEAKEWLMKLESRLTVPVSRAEYAGLASALKQEAETYNLALAFTAGVLDSHLRRILTT